MFHVTGDYVLIQDADAEYDPADIPALLKPVLAGNAQVVYGSRFLASQKRFLFWHRLANAALNFMVNRLFQSRLTDMETCYKLLPTALLKTIELKSNRFAIEPEITCKLLRQRIRIYEVPIRYVGRNFREGKKIGWRDGVIAFFLILKERV